MKHSKNLIISSENAQTNLLLVKNYNTTLTSSVEDIVSRFSTIVLDYIIVTSEKLNIKNNNYFHYIFTRGLETIIHVFKLILYYTKNIELTYQQCQKAYLYYIEFIEQISDENVSFLQLSSRDAVLFVYKKSIYDINTEYIKNMEVCSNEQELILSAVDTYISIYRSIILHFLMATKPATNVSVAVTRAHKMNSVHNFITNITALFKKYKINAELIKLLDSFVSSLIDNNLSDNIIFYNLIEEFMKKQNKLENININKINKTTIKTYIENKQFHKIVNNVLNI